MHALSDANAHTHIQTLTHAKTPRPSDVNLSAQHVLQSAVGYRVERRSRLISNVVGYHHPSQLFLCFRLRFAHSVRNCARELERAHGDGKGVGFGARATRVLFHTSIFPNGYRSGRCCGSYTLTNTHTVSFHCGGRGGFHRIFNADFPPTF